MLWAATTHLVKGADRTAERQLRAYIYVEQTNFRLAPQGWEITYRIKNFGHTPAHNVRLISIAKVVDWVNGKPADIPLPNQVQTVGSMAPSGDYFEFDEKIEGSATQVDIANGIKAIYLVGTIVYDTAFETARRTTDFRYYIGGDVGCVGHEMFADSKGNDAT